MDYNFSEVWLCHKSLKIRAFHFGVPVFNGVGNVEFTVYLNNLEVGSETVAQESYKAVVDAK